MKELIIKIRNQLLHFIYKNLAKRIFFYLDPEFVHNRVIFFGRFLGSNPVTRFVARAQFGYAHPALRQKIAGITFSNPIGLAAGFDKNAQLTKILPEVGFGFAEVGSITGESCEGNPKPRLWRHPEQKSLRVYYGLRNDGAQVVANRLAKKKFKIPIGVSIAKTNCPETADTKAAIKDYVKAYRAFEKIGDYVTVNISCPNIFGGRFSTDAVKLERLFAAINQARDKRPIFIKLSPDLTEGELDGIVYIAERHNVQGFIAGNLTKKHNYGKGGLSGRAVRELSNEQIRYLYKKSAGRFVIIGCGGVFTAEDAYEKIKAGAALIQIISGMIFEGPQVISAINQGLVELLKKDGFINIAEAVGINNK